MIQIDKDLHTIGMILLSIAYKSDKKEIRMGDVMIIFLKFFGKDL